MAFSLAEYQHLLTAVAQAQTTPEKGDTFENLVAYLIAQIEGLEIVSRDARGKADEVDLVIYNDHTNIHFFGPWDWTILVECKNWQEPVGAQEIDSLLAKLRARGLKHAFLIVRKGISGDEYHDAVLKILTIRSEGFRILVFSLADLQAVTSPAAFCELVKQKFCDLFIDKVTYR